MYRLGELNKDQLSGLANLCFDLAKGSLGLALLSTPNIPANPVFGISKIIISLFSGLAFVYFSLLLLKVKQEMKE